MSPVPLSHTFYDTKEVICYDNELYESFKNLIGVY